MKHLSKDTLTTVGSTAAVVAIGAIVSANVAPVAAVALALGSATIAAGTLYANLVAESHEKKKEKKGP